MEGNEKRMMMRRRMVMVMEWRLWIGIAAVVDAVVVVAVVVVVKHDPVSAREKYSGAF